MMDINEFEAGMLDAVLEAFAGADQLNQAQILELFGGDEELAAVIVDVLVDVGLVVKSGRETAHGLPELITRDSMAVSFLSNGGFSAQVEPQETEANGIVDNVNEPARANAKKPSLFSEPEVEPVAEDLQKAQAPLITKEVSNQDNLVDEAADEEVKKTLTTPPAKQTREVIFEVEFPAEQESSAQFQMSFQPSVEEEEEQEQYELLETKEEEQIDLPAASVEPPEPETAAVNADEVVEEEQQLVENEQVLQPGPKSVPEPEPMPVAQIDILEQVIFKSAEPEVQSAPSPDVEALEREIARLRKDQARTENKLREKDTMIHTLATQNEQLGKMRTFIWVLLGLIGVLILMMIFKKH
ncbi:hypothetical protein C8P68_101928 [Mucilaginibacter yixingensis]|uniref:Uncharacterized protein n=1 Tax=Mucilaginibacter yixingensis TaxID=1295612 RepID=A0A2T5JGY5_9SPHI|nr:hypothetical protein [Mucilaginibacter yixingensis]PTR01690.1 hypothetical protein C8P68_101928 [Mucilaginibacter yixingensis]